MRVVEKRFTTSDGLELFYRKADPGRRKAVMIFLHGLVMHSAYYTELVRMFAELGMFVLAPDLRGRGKSTNKEWKTGDLHSMKRIAQDVRELRKLYADETQGLPLYLGGVSFGSLVALQLALKSSDVAGVTIAGPPFGTYRPGLLALTELIALVNPEHEISHKATDMYSKSKAHQERLAKDPLLSMKPLKAEGAVELLRAMRLVEKNITKLTIPVLMIYGNHDEMVSKEQIAVFARLWKEKDFSVTIVENMGHEIFSDDAMRRCFEAFKNWLVQKEPKLSK
jgi:alpha-beta hydrolase superfamily lysophospholipase